MKILIVDDEALALARLQRMLNTLGYDDISQAGTAQEAMEAVKNESFDLAFLDINMPHTNGLELGYEFRYLQKEMSIIFQTAYDQHALKAYDIGAVGYLVKPYSIEQLKENIDRIAVEKHSDTPLRFMTKNKESHYLLKPEDIYYVQADLSEVIFRSKKGFSYYAQKISDIEKLLEPYEFVRIHRSTLVNLNKIKEIETIDQSKLRFSFIEIADQVESSKDGAKAFRNRFSG